MASINEFPKLVNRDTWPVEVKLWVFRCGVNERDLSYIKSHWSDDDDRAIMREGKPPDDATLRRWRNGYQIPESVKRRVLFGKLYPRYWPAEATIQLMSQAWSDGPRFNPSDTYEERKTMLAGEGKRLFEIEAEQGWPSNPNLIYVSQFVIMGARGLEDFPAEMLRICVRHDWRDVSDAAGPLVDLRRLIGLTK